MAFLSYAQNFEDVMLWRVLCHVEAGSYLDIGANDPIIDSVSRAFYERGWRGIHLEPTSQYAHLLRQDRPEELVIQAAVSDHQELQTFYEFPDTGLSTLDAAIAKRHTDQGFAVVTTVTPTLTLDDIFNQQPYAELHWMKIDVEGAEAQVLRGWCQAVIRPWIIVIESTLPMSRIPSHAEWEPILLQKGYQFVYFDGLNRYYVSDLHPELMAEAWVPPNVFDGFAIDGRASNVLSQVFRQRLQESHQLGRAALLPELESAVQSKQTALNQLVELQSSLSQCSAQALLQQQEAEAQFKQTRAELADMARLISEREQEFAERYQHLVTEYQHHVEVLRQQQINQAEIFQIQQQSLKTELLRQIDENHHLLKQHDVELQQNSAVIEKLQRQFLEVSTENLNSQQLYEQRIDELEVHLAAEITKFALQSRNLDFEYKRKIKKLNLKFSNAERARVIFFTNSLNEIKKDASDKIEQVITGSNAEKHTLEQKIHKSDKLITDMLGKLEASDLLTQEKQKELDLTNCNFQQLRVEHGEILIQLQNLKNENLEISKNYAEECRSLTEIIQKHEENLVYYYNNIVAYRHRMRFFNKIYSAIEHVLGRKNLVNDEIHFPIVDLALKEQMHVSGITKAYTMENKLITPAKSISELFTLHDKEFITCLFISLLNRLPDENGMQVYVSQLRSGVAKDEVMMQIVNSAEWRQKKISIAGLRECQRINFWKKIPVAGYVLGYLFNWSGMHVQNKQLRAVVSQLAVLDESIDGKINDLGKKLDLISARIDHQSVVLNAVLNQLSATESDSHARNSLLNIADVYQSDKHHLSRKAKMVYSVISKVKLSAARVSV